MVCGHPRSAPGANPAWARLRVEDVTNFPPDEQELANLLDEVRKASAGDSNAEEIDALRDALEHALTRWPGMTA